jgi:AraC family transcriptional regulator of adaptative response/methylated-DNA-[protein]-cysteine methyltransferase
MAPCELTDAEWGALLARRVRPGVYGVVTTGIACAFGCPSRPPLRRNAVAFATRAKAEAAGFRPCLRCGAVRKLKQNLIRTG